MSDWLVKYTSALRARDNYEQAHKQYIDAYTKLADQTASAAKVGDVTRTANIVKGGRGSAEDVVALRADLASTQKARATLTTTLKDVEAQLAQLQAERKESLSQLASLNKAKFDTERKLRDRDEELRGKAGLVQQAHDEMVSLQLELSMAEAKADRLTVENKELVDRWMKRMGEEADRVNRDSKWT